MFWPFNRKKVVPQHEPNDITYLVLKMNSDGMVKATVVPREPFNSMDEDLIGRDLAMLIRSLSDERLYPTIVGAIRDSALSPAVKKAVVRSIGNIAKSKDAVDPCDVFPNLNSNE